MTLQVPSSIKKTVDDRARLLFVHKYQVCCRGIVLPQTHTHPLYVQKISYVHTPPCVCTIQRCYAWSRDRAYSSLLHARASPGSAWSRHGSRNYLT